MKAERDRLKRLQRLERVRDIAKQTAAAEAAQAESTLAQLEALAERTRELAAGYAAHGGVSDGASLQRLTGFAGGLNTIFTSTTSDANRARSVADAKLVVLAAAERRRAAVGDRADKQAKVIAGGREMPALGTRKGFGTDLD